MMVGGMKPSKAQQVAVAGVGKTLEKGGRQFSSRSDHGIWF